MEVTETVTERRDSRELHLMEVESVHDDDDDVDFPPPPIPEEVTQVEPEFPAPPPPADLEKLSLEAEISEDPMITTPRTLRRADSMRQRMAARRIQRTWKHFYQEVIVKYWILYIIMILNIV